MSKHFFRAVRGFVFVRWLLYRRVFAAFLIYGSPVLATLYFAPTLDHFNKAIYGIPSYALLAISAIIFYRYRYYLDDERFPRDPTGETRWQEQLPRHVLILMGIAFELGMIGIILFLAPG